MKKQAALFSAGAFLSWYINWFLNEKKRRNKWLVVRGWHVHHSVYGLLLASLAGIVPFISSKKVRQHRKFFQEILVAMGLGVVAEHTVSDGFRFIEKETEENQKKRLGAKQHG